MKFRRAPGGAGLLYESLGQQSHPLTDKLLWSLDDRPFVKVTPSMTFTRGKARMMEVQN